MLHVQFRTIVCISMSSTNSKLMLFFRFFDLLSCYFTVWINWTAFRVPWYFASRTNWTPFILPLCRCSKSIWKNNVTTLFLIWSIVTFGTRFPFIDILYGQLGHVYGKHFEVLGTWNANKFFRILCYMTF